LADKQIILGTTKHKKARLACFEVSFFYKVILNYHHTKFQVILRIRIERERERQGERERERERERKERRGEKEEIIRRTT
jgi:hypothetical protein